MRWGLYAGLSLLVEARCRVLVVFLRVERAFSLAPTVVADLKRDRFQSVETVFVMRSMWDGVAANQTCRRVLEAAGWSSCV